MTVSFVARDIEVFEQAQPGASAAIREAVANDRVAHAWLLHGPAGGGQAEAARYLGAALNCHAGPTADGGRPCMTCPSCERILHGQHTAVVDFEPSGTWHRAADVRDIWMPLATHTSLDGRWKVLRVVAAERMNETTQNAFLKILEEPPPSTIWLLDVANEAALLDTIVSRCRNLTINPWPQAALRHRLDGWADLGEGDPGIGSGAEVVPPPPTGRASKKAPPTIDHLEHGPGDVERTAIVRASMGSPAMLRTLSTCGGRRLREAATTTVDRILEAGPKAAGGLAPILVNDVLAAIGDAQQRIEFQAHAELLDLGEQLGLTMEQAPGAWPRPKRGEKFPTGVEKRAKARSAWEQREVATSTCRLYLDLLSMYLQDVLVAWQSQEGAIDESAIRHVDCLSSIKRAGARMDPVGIVDALQAIQTAHTAFDLNGDRKLQLERAVVRVVLACARG